MCTVWVLDTEMNVYEEVLCSSTALASLYTIVPFAVHCPGDIDTRLLKDYHRGYTVHMFYANRGEHINYAATRMLLDLQLLDPPLFRKLYGKIKDVPRGNVVLYACTVDCVSTTLCNYTYEAFCADWPCFFRVGSPYIDYYMCDDMSTNLHTIICDYLRESPTGMATQQVRALCVLYGAYVLNEYMFKRAPLAESPQSWMAMSDFANVRVFEKKRK